MCIRDSSLTATYSSVTGSRETESNDGLSTADTITSGVAITGQISSSTDYDYYKLALSAAGTISVSFDDGNGNAYSPHGVHIIDSGGNILSSENFYESGNILTEVSSSGNYYVVVESYNEREDYSITCEIV